MKLTNLVGMLALVGLVSACGGGAKPATSPVMMASTCTATTQPSFPAKGSCTQHQAAGDYCAEFTGSNTAAQDEDSCTKIFKGTFAPGPCKTAGAVARCLVQCGQPAEGINTYYFETAATWQGKCALTKGTFLTLTP